MYKHHDQSNINLIFGNNETLKLLLHLNSRVANPCLRKIVTKTEISYILEQQPVMILTAASTERFDQVLSVNLTLRDFIISNLYQHSFLSEYGN